MTVRRFLTPLTLFVVVLGAVALLMFLPGGGTAQAAGPSECPDGSAVTIAEPFCDNYSAVDLGSVPGVPVRYGGLTFKADDPNTILIGGVANEEEGELFAIQVVRDAENHITGFSGTATVFADAPYNDGGVAYGPGGVLFLARWPVNELGQLKPGSTAADTVIDLTPYGVAPSPGGLNFVPAGYPGAGQLKLASYDTNQWYTAELAPDGTGTYTITNVITETTTAGGPEGFIYVPAGSPEFTSFDSMLVSEYDANQVSAYELDDNGDPIAETRRPFITGLTGAEGAVIDPLTGDFLFSTFGGSNRVVAVRGFAAPEPTAVTVSALEATPERPAGVLLGAALVAGLAAIAGARRFHR